MALVGHAEREHGAARPTACDRVVERAGLVADRLDHDVGAVVVEPRAPSARRCPTPHSSTPNVGRDVRRSIGSTPVTCAAPRGLSAWLNSRPIEPWPITATRAARDVAEPVERVEDRAQRLDHGRSTAAARRRSRARRRRARGSTPRAPCDGRPSRRRARPPAPRRPRLDDLADELVQRVARLTVGAGRPSGPPRRGSSAGRCRRCRPPRSARGSARPEVGRGQVVDLRRHQAAGAGQRMRPHGTETPRTRLCTRTAPPSANERIWTSSQS